VQSTIAEPPPSDETLAKLVALARAESIANGDPNATADAVKTTYQLLALHDPPAFATLMADAQISNKTQPPNSSPLWVILEKGRFDNGNTVGLLYVDGTSLRELAGSAGGPDQDLHYETILRGLGTVVSLYR